MSKKHKIGTITPTCSPERKPLVDFALKRISEQTMSVDYVCVIDYPNTTRRPDLTKRYKDGIRECFENGCDLVLFIEDDDYYPTTYVADMYDAWIKAGKPAVIGANETIYYHLFSRGYLVMKTKNHASAHGTAVSKGATIDCADDNDPFYDMKLWKANRGVAKLVDIPNHCISIKHGVGLVGGGGHTKKEYGQEDDAKYTLLRQWVDAEAFEIYMAFIKKHGGNIDIKRTRRGVVSTPKLKTIKNAIAKTDRSAWGVAVKWIHDEKIIEIGCGDGKFAALCFAHGKNYQKGVDYNSEQIDKAKHNNPTHANKFKVLDVESVSAIPANHCVVALDSLQFMELDDRVVRKLPIGTRFIFTVSNQIEHGAFRKFDNSAAIGRAYPELDLNRIRKIRSGETIIFLIDSRRVEHE